MVITSMVFALTLILGDAAQPFAQDIKLSGPHCQSLWPNLSTTACKILQNKEIKLPILGLNEHSFFSCDCTKIPPSRYSTKSQPRKKTFEYQSDVSAVKMA